MRFKISSFLYCRKMSNIAMKTKPKSIEKSRKIWFNRKKQLFLKLQKDLRVKANFISKFYNF